MNNNGVIQPEQYIETDNDDDDDDDDNDEDDDDSDDDAGDELMDNEDTQVIVESNSKSPSSDLFTAVERSPRQKKERKKSLERLTQIRQEEVRSAK